MMGFGRIFKPQLVSNVNVPLRKLAEARVDLRKMYIDVMLIYCQNLFGLRKFLDLVLTHMCCVNHRMHEY